MRRILLGALVLALSTTTLTHAEQPTLAGDVCEQRTSVRTETVDGRWHTIVRGGPLAAARVVTMVPAVDEVLDDNLYSITLTCTLKVGWWNDHTSPAADSASSTGLAVAVLPPTLMAFDSDDVDTPTGVCSEVTVTDRDGDSATLYWDVYDESFGTDPSVACGPVVCPLDTDDACDGPPSIPPEPVRDVVDIANQVFVEHVDPAVCPVLGGDVPDVWDCPPYQEN